MHWMWESHNGYLCEKWNWCTEFKFRLNLIYSLLTNATRRKAWLYLHLFLYFSCVYAHVCLYLFVSCVHPCMSIFVLCVHSCMSVFFGLVYTLMYVCICLSHVYTDVCLYLSVLCINSYICIWRFASNALILIRKLESMSCDQTLA